MLSVAHRLVFSPLLNLNKKQTHGITKKLKIPVLLDLYALSTSQF
jgi:hypothetical protein